MADEDTLHHAFGIALATLEALLIERGVLLPSHLSMSLDAMAEGQEDVAVKEALEDWAGMLAQVDAEGETRQ